MTKFDNDSVHSMLARDAAYERHPNKADGQPQHFGVFARPQVETGPIRGEAVAWTPNYGLIQWTDSKGLQHMEWFHAADIKRQ